MLDIKKLEKRLDDFLVQESVESLNNWLQEKRKNMNELIRQLDDVESRILEISEISKKSKNFGGKFLDTEIRKKFEDGILEHITNASLQQLETLKKGFKWSYYPEYNNEVLLDKEIQKRLRNNKLNQILDKK